MLNFPLWQVMSELQKKYPATEIFKALNALNLNLDISDIDDLYVNFDGVRSESSFAALMINLGIFNNRINEAAGNAKILYTGHTGSGKSTELLKLHHRLNQPEQYFSIYLDVEDYIPISNFESEDLMILLIASFVSALEDHHINHGVPGLQKIAEEWLSVKEVNDEIKSKLSNEAGVSGDIGTAGLLKFFSAKLFLKSLFSYESQSSTIIRKKIKEKQGDYVIALNVALLEIKKEIRRLNKGIEIIFIIDGLEKLRWGKYDIYTKTFFQNIGLITGIECSLIFCVPIDTLYDPKTSPILSIYKHFTLPLIAINAATIPLFSHIITKRIDKATFFEEGVLEYCVSQSGGSPRQLIRIVDMALTNSEPDGFKINKQGAEKVCKTLGLDIMRRLTSPHFDKLKSGEYDRADPLILDLLFSLSLMECNGDENMRKPNPLLIPFLKNDRSI
jgi:hypothetical protein